MLKISVVGLWLIGQQHLKAVKENSDCKVVSVIDKSEIAKKIAADENPAHHNTSENCYWIGGTESSAELPKGTFCSQTGVKSWREPIKCEVSIQIKSNAFKKQLDNFLEVIQGYEKPFVTGLE